ncbi:uncharacterized protein BYT42DRAFT_611369 [Radiomyces spectabilis]|uniref:uncharacterized protein n=1 Tax=Radiomyces spectabilis TaxID=64574 RepID=UPI00221E396A|nr:uncharacterized protein BYT42DRAFT_611369 [Radiomyces spectabilis]KAI8388308.1 hypothetical protein BYT42DRAFT_611369 [Radiomyces spectabilis]
MLRNKILVTGHPNAGTLEFVKGILTTTQSEFRDADVQKAIQDADNTITGISIPWTINTKYYVADVAFWLDEIPVENIKETAQAYAEESNEVARVVDAFVFVFQSSKSESFHDIRHWLPFLEACDPAIRLCIDTSSPSATPDTNFEDWCLEHQFEYINMHDTTEIDLDKAGLDLAVDVLQTNMWDGLIRKHNEAKPAGPQGNIGSLQDEETIELLKELQSLKLQHEKDQEGNEKFSSELDDPAKDDIDDDDDLELPSAADIERMQQQLFGGIEEEDGLDKTFELMKAMREQSQNLPDEERRKLAAQVALSFAAQLGI